MTFTEKSPSPKLGMWDDVQTIWGRQGEREMRSGRATCRGMGIKHAKVRGEWVELWFMLRAVELGLHLSKPWGEVMPYDFVVEHLGKFVRVQVKSTMFQDRGGYSCSVRGWNGPYQG